MTRIVTSLHGQKAGLTQEGRLMVPAGFISGEHGSQLSLPSPSRAAHFDDFLGSAQVFGTTVVNGWLSRKGTTNAVDWTVTAAPGGTVVGKVGDTTASMAVSGVQLDSGLDWKANQGDVVFQARVKTGIITNIAIFIGLTDQVAALEMPIHSAASANTITTNADDAVGFFFDTSMTADTWWLAGVKATTDATHQNTGFAPVADTYETFRIELGADGSAVFYRNGVQVGTKMDNAVTATVALTPVIAAFNRTTANGATTIVTADYISVSGLRV